MQLSPGMVTDKAEWRNLSHTARARRMGNEYIGRESTINYPQLCNVILPFVWSSSTALVRKKKTPQNQVT